MENLTEMDLKNLINELILGKELAKQLQVRLNVPTSSLDTRELLVHGILNSYDKALYLLRASANIVTETQNTGMIAGTAESQRSLSLSPGSEDSDREFHRDHQQDLRDNNTPRRRRNAMPRWTKYLQVSPGTGLEGPLDDGFTWRKYGQKDILGAKHPRGYYRCTHRDVQGCLATKQVQRSDDDPTVFQITYRGRHTCSQGSSEANPPPLLPERPEPRSGVNYPQIISQPQQNQHELLSSFQTGLKVITENIDNTHDQPFSSLNFPSTATTNAKNYAFIPFATENISTTNPSSSFVSPTSTASNYFSVSSSHTNNFTGNLSSHPSESELTDLVSAATSSTNSLTFGFQNPFSGTEFDPSFTFGNPGFFS